MNNLLEGMLGKNNSLKVLEFLYQTKPICWSITEIADQTELSRTAVRKAIEQYLKNEQVLVAKVTKDRKHYTVNTFGKYYKVTRLLIESLDWDGNNWNEIQKKVNDYGRNRK